MKTYWNIEYVVTVKSEGRIRVLAETQEEAEAEFNKQKHRDRVIDEASHVSTVFTGVEFRNTGRTEEGESRR
jgi:phenylacetate-coenzyme A ligase PaaK-like adenylate-forming protein